MKIQDKYDEIFLKLVTDSEPVNIKCAEKFVPKLRVGLNRSQQGYKLYQATCGLDYAPKKISVVYNPKDQVAKIELKSEDTDFGFEIL